VREGQAPRRRRWLREPLLHFALLGVGLFALHGVVAGDDARPGPARTIEVSAELVASLRLEHERRAGRAPTEAELEAAVQRWVDEEVLYREALSLGLDRGDPVVRRRLIQKMAFLSEDLVEVPAPSEAELTEWLEANRDRYRRPERLTLEHVYFRRLQAGTPERVGEALDALRGGASYEGLGDPFVRGRRFATRTSGELDGVFGPGFAAALGALPAGEWAGPVTSGFGEHLVRVVERAAARDPELPEVEREVRRDWLAARQDEANAAAMERLRGGWEIRLPGSGRSGLSEGAVVEVRP
jgi:peptidyl-prolyl cis-trans isomerase C